MTYTRELARIKATQEAYEYRHHGRPTNVFTFNEWTSRAFELIEQKGGQIESGTVNGERAFKFTKQNGESITVKLAEIRADYEKNYLKQEAEA